MKFLLAALLAALCACASLNKDHHPKDPPSAPMGDDARAQLKVYRPLLAAQADSHGLVVMGGSIGDSALFSCLGYAAGALHFDPAVLFTPEGKPLRHPDIAPSATPNPTTGGRGTPISHDMVDGILWCMYSLAKVDTPHARDLVAKMVAFGKAHPEHLGTDIGWNFCTADDRVNYKITDEDWFGRCYMPPSMVKDIYRVAKHVGLACDEDCLKFMTIGPNLPANSSGFQRHLAVISTIRNGLVEGAINDNSLKIVLQNAANEQPRNALYQAAYHLFGDGDQTAAFKDLADTALFPAGALPTGANFCTEYLFQRDEQVNGAANPDWLPCPSPAPGSQGRGIEFVFAAALAVGEIR